LEEEGGILERERERERETQFEPHTVAIQIIIVLDKVFSRRSLKF
jgi:hypothetical protein